MQLQHYYLHLNAFWQFQRTWVYGALFPLFHISTLIQYTVYVYGMHLYKYFSSDQDILFRSIPGLSLIRITEFLRLEGTWGGCWSNFLLKTGLSTILDWVSQHLFRSDLENFQTWRLHLVFGQLLLALNDGKVFHTFRQSLSCLN